MPKEKWNEMKLHQLTDLGCHSSQMRAFVRVQSHANPIQSAAD